MKTQVGETAPLGVRYLRDGSPSGQEPLLARCCRCNRESFFSARQVAAAQRIWKLGSGRDGIAAEEFLGGDGTTNHCACGMEVEVVFIGEKKSKAHWRQARQMNCA